MVHIFLKTIAKKFQKKIDSLHIFGAWTVPHLKSGHIIKDRLNCIDRGGHLSKFHFSYVSRLTPSLSTNEVKHDCSWIILYKLKQY